MGDLNVIIDLRDGGDWSLDLCYAGLVKNLGPYQVIDIPYKKKHREWQDVVDGVVSPDWGLERRTLGYTGIIESSPGIVSGRRDVALLLQTGRVKRVWLDERSESFVKYCELGFARAGIPVVVVAGHDRFWNYSPQFVANQYGDRLEAMLLDNWISEYDDLPFRCNRIGWSCNFDHYWDRPVKAPKKDIDISFVGYNSHPDRARFIDHILDRWPSLKSEIVLERQADTTSKFILKRDYFDIIQRSRVCLSLRGAAVGGKTMRFYEIPYVGSYMLSQVIHDQGVLSDMVGGVHCDYFSDETELDRKIERALDDVPYRELIASQGGLRSSRDLIVAARWRAVLDWLEQPSWEKR